MKEVDEKLVLWFGNLLPGLMETFPSCTADAVFPHIKNSIYNDRITWLEPRGNLNIYLYIHQAEGSFYHLLEFDVYPPFPDTLRVSLRLYRPMESLYWTLPDRSEGCSSSWARYPGRMSPQEVVGWVKETIVPGLSLKLFS